MIILNTAQSRCTKKLKNIIEFDINSSSTTQTIVTISKIANSDYRNTHKITFDKCFMTKYN